MSLVGGGGYAEYACARAAHLLRIPSSMSFDEAACVCESYLTAYLNVFMLGRLQPTETVLLHGGGGGVNTAALQLCRALTPDVRCLVTAAPDKIERVRGLGADCVIDYTSTGDFSTIVQEQTANRGVDVILDHVGAKYLEPNMKSLAYAGRLVVIGVISGIKAELNLALMMVKRQQIIGSVIRSRPVDEKAQLVATFAGHGLPSFAARDIVPIIDAVFPLEAAADAHRMMEADRHFGKIVLRVRDD